MPPSGSQLVGFPEDSPCWSALRSAGARKHVQGHLVRRRAPLYCKRVAWSGLPVGGVAASWRSGFHTHAGKHQVALHWRAVTKKRHFFFLPGLFANPPLRREEAQSTFCAGLHRTSFYVGCCTVESHQPGPSSKAIQTSYCCRAQVAVISSDSARAENMRAVTMHSAFGRYDWQCSCLTQKWYHALLAVL